MPNADNPNSTPPPEAAVPAVTTQSAALTCLRSARETLVWSLRAICIGVLLMLVTIVGSLLSMEVGVSAVILIPATVIAIPSALLIVLGLLGATVAGIAWFLVVYFGYTQFSLRTFLIMVWTFAGILALLVTENGDVQKTGILLLILFVAFLIFCIAGNDPLAGSVLKKMAASKKNGQSPDGRKPA